MAPLPPAYQGRATPLQVINRLVGPVRYTMLPVLCTVVMQRSRPTGSCRVLLSQHITCVGREYEEGKCEKGRDVLI